MAKLETDFNRSPYFDDYVDVAEGKDYHRVLFKPGLAVQTRELTQLQSMMQEQIARFGDNIFKEGTIVDGCAFQYDANVAFVRIRDRDSGGNTVNISNFANGIVTGQSSGVRAKIIAVASGTEANIPDTNVMMVKYLNGGTTNTAFANANEYKTFATNEVLSYLPADGGTGLQANTFNAGTGSSAPFGFGSVYFTGEGVIFGKGHFVNVQPQAIILEKFSSKPSYKVGFKITETLVNSDSDQTLLDNARGSYNYTAPGADRLKLTASLTKKVLGTANTESFTPIFTVDNGLVQTIKTRSVYDVLGDELAERTFDESGNYEIKRMQVNVKEHYNTGSNFGKWNPGSVAPGPVANTQKLAIGVEPGEAYVSGYHQEHFSTMWAETDKGIDIQTESLVDVSLSYSNYVDVVDVVGYFDPSQHTLVSLRSANSNVVEPGTFGNGSAAGNELGTALVKNIEFVSGTPGSNTASVYRMYLMDVKMANGSFSDVKSIHHNDGTINSHANIKLTDDDKPATLVEPSFAKSVFDSGLTAVKRFTNASGVVNAQYRYREAKDISIGTSGQSTVTFSATAAAGGQDQLAYGVGTDISDALKQTIILVNAGSAVTGSISSTIAPGQIIDLTAAHVTVDIDSATQFTIDLGETLSGTMTAKVFFNMDRELAVPADKVVRKNRYVKLDLNTNSAGTAGPWSLGFPDVFKIRNVYLGSTYSTDNRNVTNEFNLLTNQTDTIYKMSQLAIKSGSILNLKSSDKLLVEFDYFHHDRTDGIGFFTIDSYPIDPNESTANTTAITTPEIPQFQSLVSDKLFDLRDSIDFRVRYTPTGTDATTVGTASENPGLLDSGNPLDVDGTFGSRVPVPNLTWESDAQFYLPRIDRVVVARDGTKRVLRGISRANPYPPQAPAESMSLALLFIPPFPSLSQENARRFNRLDQAVTSKPIANKRYRMRDIAAIDQRVGSLEYYTSLSLLEKAATDLQIVDDNGLNRFKNGIFVDSFFSHNFADRNNDAYRIAVNSERGEIRPKFETFNLDLELDTTAGVARKGKHKRVTVTGASTYTAVSVSATSGGTGTVRDFVLVSGDPDTSSATYRLYIHGTSGTFAVSDTITGGGGGTISEVVDADTTDALMLNYTHQEYAKQPWASNLINPVSELQFNWVGEITLTPEADHWKDVTTLPEFTFDIDLASPFEDLTQALGTQWGDWNQTQTVERETIVETFWAPTKGTGEWRSWRTEEIFETTTTTDIREGIRFETEVNTDTQSSGPFVTDVGTVPFIRSREITFSATGMRPNTRVYAYFEDTPVQAYITPTGGTLGGQLVTDDAGKCSGTFLIPNNDQLKFRVGERVFKLLDVADPIVEAGNVTTSGSAKYNASGMTVSQKGISVTTREPTIVAVPETEVITTTSTVDVTPRPADPIAQTFVVGDFEYTNPSAAHGASGTNKNFGVGADGVFVTGIDLYFERKPSGQNGISVELREVVNGTITNIRVPLGYKRLEVADINTSSDSTAVTPFYFPAPVYLRGGKEYAFVVKPDGDDPGYRIWTSRLGGDDVRTGSKIDQQPAIGMLFTSANDRTYSPRQNEDIKFTIWRASFATGSSNEGSITLTNQSDEYVKITDISGNFTTGETLIGESLFTFSGNSANIAVGDRVKAANTGTAAAGIVRSIVGTSPLKIRADLHTDQLSSGNLLHFNRQGDLSKTYTGTLSAIANTGATGQVQFYNGGAGDLTIDSSGGAFVANTTSNNGYLRGLTSNSAAQMYNVKTLKYNLISPKLSIAQYVGTNVSTFVKTTANTPLSSSAIDSTFTSIRPDADYEFYDSEKIVAGATLEANTYGGNKTLTLKTTMSTDNDRLSPIFDLGRAKSLVMVKNVINNTANNEFGNYGLANAKYISKKVVLADGQDAEDIKVIVDAYRPAGTDVQVWVRVQNEFDTGEDFSDKHYTKMVASTTQKRDSSITNKSDFVEVEYNFPTSRDSTTLYSAFANSASTPTADVVQYKSITGDVLYEGFKYYSVKIVLTSTGSHLVPRVRALRAIALQR